MTHAPLTVGVAQIDPVWLDRAATLARMAAWVSDAAAQGCGLVVFGEAGRDVRHAVAAISLLG